MKCHLLVYLNKNHAQLRPGKLSVQARLACAPLAFRNAIRNAFNVNFRLTCRRPTAQSLLQQRCQCMVLLQVVIRQRVPPRGPWTGALKVTLKEARIGGLRVIEKRVWNEGLMMPRAGSDSRLKRNVSLWTIVVNSAGPGAQGSKVSSGKVFVVRALINESRYWRSAHPFLSAERKAALMHRRSPGLTPRPNTQHVAEVEHAT
jgi:hypothetical protein